MVLCSPAARASVTVALSTVVLAFAALFATSATSAPVPGNGDWQPFSALDHICSASVQQQLLQSAENGHESAQYYVGAILFDGVCGEIDEVAGLAWILAAAEGGLVDAQHDYGRLALASANTEQQRYQALYWLGAAAGQGDALSALALAHLHETGMHGLNRDICLALDWYAAVEALGSDDLADHAEVLREAEPAC